MSNEILLPTGTLGYRFDVEDKGALEQYGESPMKLLQAFRETVPAFDVQADPAQLVRILDQKNQGACQGHALAMVFSICYFLMTGRWLNFSRAAAYYLSQRKDGIRGDQGSTLNGGRWVATEHGLCLEEDWRYPSSYDPTEPPNVPYLYKLKMTRPMRTVQEVMDWINAGLPVQTGFAWNDSCSREIVTNWRTGGGGHSTCFWLRSRAGNVKNINSWSNVWNGDGVHEWTEASIAACLRDKWTTLVGYAPDGMQYPEPPPLT